MTNLETVEQAVSLAKHSGANEAEAFLTRVRVLTIEVTNGEVETIKQAEDIGLTIRALVRGAMGLSYVTDLNETSAQRAAQRAVEIARASEADPNAGFSGPAKDYPPVASYDPEMERHSPDEKIERALAIERAARAYDARIVLTRRITYTERARETVIANSLGLLAAQKSSACGGLATVIARQGTEQQVGGGSDFQRRYAAFDPSRIGVEAAEHAVGLLGATPAPTQRGSILLEPKMTAAFLQMIANLVCADNVQKNKSLLVGKIGQVVAATGFSLVDDGAHPDAPGARSWDDEGIPSQRTSIIANGILQNYLHSTYTARKANTRSTSNAARLVFKVQPDPHPSNLILEPGAISAKALQSGISRGLWVKHLMNLHTANPISGEFSFGASGMWIENGNVAGPVRGVTIAGNLVDLMMNIHGISNDLTWSGAMGGSVGAPSMLIQDLSIAGK